MKQFFTIFRFEIKNFLKEKAFIIITVIFCLVALIGLSIPRIIDFFNSNNTNTDENQKLVISGFADDTSDNIKTIFKETLSALNYDVTFKNASEDEINDLVKNNDYDCAILITSDTKFKYIVNELSLYDENAVAITELMKIKYRTEKLVEMGLSEVDALTMNTVNIECETVSLNVDISKNFFSAYILLMLIFMCVVMYGSIIASNVAAEKSSRAMEMLITSASPKNMMFAKISASISACIIQLALVIICALVSYGLNYEYYKDNIILQSILGMDAMYWVFIVLFFIMGFLIYSFLFGALGSLVSRIEDVNVVITPVMMALMIVAYVIIFNIENPTSTLMIVLSFIPISSPMAMYVRIVMGTVSNIEIVISIVLLLVTTVLIGYLATIIYRLGTLLYGNTPKFKDIFKLLKNNKDNN